MNSAALKKITRRELARRVNGGLEITLYWRAHDNSVSIDIHHTATGETIGFPVRSDRALEAFHHPFAHLAEQNDPAASAAYVEIARRA
jgi:hypothetical protein